MNNLERKILELANAYYQGQELVPDNEYDALVELLRKSNPDSEIFKKEVVGNDLTGVSKKYKLPITMGTLKKCTTEESFRQWFSKNFYKKMLLEAKVDGVGVLLKYLNGELVFAYSRGDSEYGEDLTKNIMLVNNVPKEISKDFSGYIRGEVVVYKKIFEEYFQNESNPRNTAAGKIKQKNGTDCDKLNFIAYDVFSDNENDCDKTETNKLNFLEKNNFEVPYNKEITDVEQVIEIRNKINFLREKLFYNIDGLVLKQEIVDKEDLERKTPLKNCAFKPELEIAISKVTDIIWQLSGKFYSPLAIIEPVELCGTVVSKASISNINIMNSLGIYIGAEVEITKNGEIIPGVLKVLNPKQNAFDIPKVCEVCGEDLVINPSGFPTCVNKECPRKMSHRFSKMFDLLKIKGCGKSFINNLEKNKISIKNFLDMCNSLNDEIFNDFAGGINGKKIFTQMNTALKSPVTISRFLALFDYDGFGEKKLELLGCKTLEDVFSLTPETVINTYGFDEITTNNFFIFIKEYEKEIKELSNYFTIGEQKTINGKLNGYSFCFTGKASMPKSKLFKLVEDNGGTVFTSVKKGLSYLVSAEPDSNSNKFTTAKKLGINIISEEEFKNML